MAVPLSLGPVHHLRLTVTDVERSRVFYTELLGFQIAMDTPPPIDDPHHDLATDLPPFGIAVLPFKDPDGVALELTAPL
jgi:catechol 2,3-dioxygenase-like lactoylglutathione lyase family enzyme